MADGLRPVLVKKDTPRRHLGPKKVTLDVPFKEDEDGTEVVVISESHQLPKEAYPKELRDKDKDHRDHKDHKDWQLGRRSNGWLVPIRQRSRPT
eukprot:Skav220998  [mRNA]  locus=scaffold2318:56655:61912:+ [translate_table: standard]